jgi:hypothetical protein
MMSETMIECYIGIDPGSTTGFAAWDARLQEYEEFLSGDFWQVYERINQYPMETTIVFLEDPNLISPTFPRDIRERGKRRDAIMQKIGQKVGMNKRDAQLLQIGLQSGGWMVHTIKPTGRAGTKRKWTAQTFQNITGHHAGLNEHVRDAAMMVFGQPLVPVSRFKQAGGGL